MSGFLFFIFTSEAMGVRNKGRGMRSKMGTENPSG